MRLPFHSEHRKIYPCTPILPGHDHSPAASPTDQPVKLIRREMPYGITFPGTAEGPPGAGSGYTAIHHVYPPENFMRERALLVKTKAAPSCHAALSSFRTYCVSMSIPRRISTGFTTRNMLSGVSMAKCPENVG